MLIKLFVFSCCFVSIYTSFNPNDYDNNEPKTSSPINSTSPAFPIDVPYYYNVNEKFHLKCNNTYCSSHCGSNNDKYYWFIVYLTVSGPSRATTFTDCECLKEYCISDKKVTLTDTFNNSLIYCCVSKTCREQYIQYRYHLLLTTEPTADGQIVQKRVLNEKNYIIIILASLSGVLILFAIAMIFAYFKKWKLCNKYGKNNRNGHNGAVQAETYASSQNLTYAELQMKSTNRQLIINEATPYAKIIGVLEPSKDN